MTGPRAATGAGTLRTRVTAVAGLALTAAVMFGLLLLYLLQRQTAQRTVEDQLRTYGTQIAQSAETGVLPQLLPASTLDPNAQAQVLDGAGRVLASTRALAGLPALYTMPEGSSRPLRQKVADSSVSREVQVVGTPAKVAGRPVTIITGTSTDLLAQVNETFARLLLLGVPGILVLALLTVWLVVGRALRPVEEITRAVTEVGASDLSRRVPEPGTSDEIGELARTMNGMLARLEASAAQQRRFAADASHELRSPLAAIRTALEVGLAHPERAPWPEIAQRATRQSARLEHLVEQLLLLATADDHPSPAPLGQVEMGTLLEGVRAGCVPGDVEVVFERPPAAVLVAGDADHLSRLVRNLLDNAIRHARSTVAVSVVACVETVEVTVRDDGPGIPAPQRERVFDRFVRLDASRERASGSTGLGLAIAREIATAHGGRISIGEAPGGGAAVTVTLPTIPSASANSA